MEFSNLPTSLDVTLYKYNYIDNQLWARIYNELDYIEIDEDSIIVHTDLLIELLQEHYQPMLKKIGSVGADFVHKEVNTIYFLVMILQQFEKVSFIKFTKSYKKEYSRMIESLDEKMIRFDFKVLTATFRLAEFFTRRELKIINKHLFEAKILTDQIPYNTYKLSELLDTFDQILAKVDQDSTDADLFAGLLDLIDQKLESDNPTVLLVTDY